MMKTVPRSSAAAGQASAVTPHGYGEAITVPIRGTGGTAMKQKEEGKGGHGMKVKSRSPLVVGILLLALFLPLAGPPNASAITLEGCELLIGTTCDLNPVLFSVIQANPANPALLNAPFAEVAVSVESFAADAFEYRYQIINPRFAVQVFQIDLSPAFALHPIPVTNAPGDFTKGLSGPNIVAPSAAGMLSDQFVATFLSPPITAAGGGIKKSDIMFIQSPLSPADLFGFLAGQDELSGASLLSFATIQGPGGTLTAAAQNPAPVPSPEPSTLLLLGSGLLGLAAALRSRRSSSESC